MKKIQDNFPVWDPNPDIETDLGDKRKFGNIFRGNLFTASYTETNCFNIYIHIHKNKVAIYLHSYINKHKVLFSQMVI